MCNSVCKRTISVSFLIRKIINGVFLRSILHCFVIYCDTLMSSNVQKTLKFTKSRWFKFTYILCLACPGMPCRLSFIVSLSMMKRSYIRMNSFHSDETCYCLSKIILNTHPFTIDHVGHMSPRNNCTKFNYLWLCDNIGGPFICKILIFHSSCFLINVFKNKWRNAARSLRKVSSMHLSSVDIFSSTKLTNVIAMLSIIS